MNAYDVFVEVVNCKSFSGAAKKLHRSPSAISKQISLLEQKLDVQLVDRTTRSLSVTQAGEFYYERCLDISERMQRAESEVKELSNDPKGVINITWPSPLNYSPIPKVLSQFGAKYPEILVNVDVNESVVNLSQEKVDFAFRTGPILDSGMVAVPLFFIQPILCVSPEWIERYGVPKDIRELSGRPLIMQSNINLMQKVRTQFPELKEMASINSHMVNDHVGILQLIKHGLGASVLFRGMVEEELQAGSLVQLLPNVELPKVPVNLMYHKLDYMPKRLRCMIEFFKASFQ